MKKQISRKTALILLIIFTLMAACTQQNENNTTAEAVDSEPLLPATINGEITFQANTSDSTLYVVNVDDPTLSYKLDVPGSMNEANPMKPASYSIEVAPGNYYLFTYTTNGVMAAAYAGTADESLYVLTLSSGETANEIDLRLVYPQYPCQLTQLPASPDGVYPAVETNTTCIDEYNASQSQISTPATINGEITFQANTSDSTLYVVNVDDPTLSYKLDVPGSMNEANPMKPASFSIEVAPGNYYLFTYTTNGVMAAAYAGAADGSLYVLTLNPGETANEINLRLVYPQYPCQFTQLPASPDGVYPAVETNTTCIEEYNAFETKTAAESGSSGDPTETAPAVISGTIGYQGPPTPTSILYIVNPYTGNWYWTEILGSANTISFSYTVEPGTYILYAHQSDGAGSQAAAFMNTDGTVAEMVLRSGQILDGVTMTFAYPTSPCQRTAIPASPDGRYSAIAKTC